MLRLIEFVKRYELCVLNTFVVIVYTFLMGCENYIVDNIAFVEDNHMPSQLLDPNEAPCRVNLTLTESISPYIQTHIFKWTLGQREMFKRLDLKSLVIANMACGVCSDKFGGHLIIFIGLVFSGTIMSLLYLSKFLYIPTIFVVVWTARTFNNAVVMVASMSLLGKTTRGADRPLAAASIVCGLGMGTYAGEHVPHLVGDWEHVSYLCGGVSLTTAVLWWLFYRSPHFPAVPNTPVIPWFMTFITPSFYSLLMLNLTVENIRLLRPTLIHYMDNVVNRTDTPRYDWAFQVPLYCSEALGALFCGVVSRCLFSRRLLALGFKKSFLMLALLLVFCTTAALTQAGCHTKIVTISAAAVYFAYGLAATVFLSICLDVAPTYAGTFAAILILLTWPYVFVLRRFLKWYLTFFGSKDVLTRWKQIHWVTFAISAVCPLPFLLLRTKQVPLDESSTPQLAGENSESKTGDPYRLSNKVAKRHSDETQQYATKPY